MSKAREALEVAHEAIREAYFSHGGVWPDQGFDADLLDALEELVRAALAAAERREHRYDEDGECEVCGQEQACRPAIARTVRREPVAWIVERKTAAGGWAPACLPYIDRSAAESSPALRGDYRIRPLGYLDAEGDDRVASPPLPVAHSPTYPPNP